MSTVFYLIMPFLAFLGAVLGYFHKSATKKAPDFSEAFLLMGPLWFLIQRLY
jgi:hypothetical protein